MNIKYKAIEIGPGLVASPPIFIAFFIGRKKMTITVKLYVRDIYWKDMLVPEGTQHVNFALQSSNGDIRTIRAPVHPLYPGEDYQSGIEDEDVAIYNRNTLCEVKRSRMPMYDTDAYRPENNKKLERFEILDLEIR